MCLKTFNCFVFYILLCIIHFHKQLLSFWAKDIKDGRKGGMETAEKVVKEEVSVRVEDAQRQIICCGDP